MVGILEVINFNHMEFQITDNWKLGIKFFSISECANIKRWLFCYKNYNNTTNAHGFEVRILGITLGCLSRPY